MGKFTNIEAADQGLNRSVLIAQWRRVYGCSPPKYLSLRLIYATLAWDAQANATSGIPAKTLQALKNAGRSQNAISTINLKAGVTLVREWNGRTYQVNVLEHGFCMDGKIYTSLTAIAKKITGAKWSGPRFFGLTGKRGVKHA